MIYSEACSCGAKFHIEENSDRVERIDQMIGDWRRLHATRCASYPWPIGALTIRSDGTPGTVRPSQPHPMPTQQMYEPLGGGGPLKWAKPATAYEVVNGWPEVTGRAE